MATVHEKAAMFDVIAVRFGFDPRKVPPEHVVAAVEHARKGAAILRSCDSIDADDPAAANQWCIDDGAVVGK